MARTDAFSLIQGLPFVVISTPRTIRLTDFDPGGQSYMDYVRISNRGHAQPVFVGINGATASSTTSTVTALPTPTPRAQFWVMKEEVYELYTHVSRLSLSTTGTAATISLLFGRY
jgi:lipoprotein-anchoring transpeptidase ErfK/SrfK